MLKRIGQSLVLGAALTASVPAFAVVTATAGEKLTYDFNLAYNASNTSNIVGAAGFGSNWTPQDGNTVTFASSQKGLTLKATASAWTATGSGSSWSISDAELGLWDRGLGVENRQEGEGAGNQHQIDNYLNPDGTYSTDFVLLEFDHPVTLTALTRYSYALSGNSKVIDNDAVASSIMPVSTTKTVAVTTETSTKYNVFGQRTGTPSTRTAGTTTTSSANAPIATTAELKAANAATGRVTSSTSAAVESGRTSSGSGLTKVTTVKTQTTKTDSTVQAPTINPADFNLAAKDNGVAGNTKAAVDGKVLLAATSGVVLPSKTWLVGASFTNLDGRPDGFKLSGVQVTWNAVVPEPQTWAMMMLGFGFVGVALRRQRRGLAAA